MFNNSRNRESYYNYSGNELLTTYFHNIQHSNDDDYHDNHRNIFKYSYQNARHQQPTTSTELPSPASLSSSSSSLSPPAAELPLHPVNLPQKRVVANLRERRRMRLINRAFSGLRSRLPEELFYSSTTLFNPTCDSVVYNNQNPIVIRKDNEVTNRWSQRNTNPVHSYLRKLSISKVDILRAAINYIHLLQKMLNEVDCNHSAQGYSDNFNQFNAVELKAMNSGDASQSSSSSFYNIDESVGQQLHSNLVSLTVIRTKSDYCSLYVHRNQGFQNETFNLIKKQIPSHVCSDMTSSANSNAYENTNANLTDTSGTVCESCRRIRNSTRLVRCKQTWWPKIYKSVYSCT